MPVGSLMRELELIDDFIREISDRNSVGELTEIVSKYLKKMGFEASSYIRFDMSTGLNNPEITPEDITYIADCRSDWEEHYAKESLHIYDPVSRIALIRGSPVSWGEAAETVSQTPMPDRVLKEARDFALRSGFAVPAFSSDGFAGMFGVLSSMEEEAFGKVYRESRHIAHLLAIHLHTRIAAISASAEASAPVRLSGRETEVLLWTSAGKTVWEISQILDVSVHTVDFHIRNAMRKFGVHSKAQAVAQMIQRRIAQP